MLGRLTWTMNMLLALGVASSLLGCMDAEAISIAEGRTYYDATLDSVVVLSQEGDTLGGDDLGINWPSLSLSMMEAEPGLLQVELIAPYEAPVIFEGRIEGSGVVLLPPEGTRVVVFSDEYNELSITQLEVEDLRLAESEGRLEGITMRCYGLNDEVRAGGPRSYGDIEAELHVSADLTGPRLAYESRYEHSITGTVSLPVAGRDRPLRAGGVASVVFSEPLSDDAMVDLVQVVGGEVEVSLNEDRRRAGIRVRPDAGVSEVMVSFPRLEDRAGNSSALGLQVMVAQVGPETASQSRVGFEPGDVFDSWGAREMDEGCAGGAGCLGFDIMLHSASSQGFSSRLRVDSTVNVLRLQTRVQHFGEPGDHLGALMKSPTVRWRDLDASQSGSERLELTSSEAGDSGWVQHTFALPPGVKHIFVEFEMVSPYVPGAFHREGIVMLDNVELVSDETS